MSGKRSICITSADGQTGHLIAELLLTDPSFKSKFDNLVCVAFDPEQCDDLTELGAQVIPLDEQLVLQALRGCDTIMLIPPSVSNKLALTQTFIQLAAEAVVPNTVLLSAAGCDLAEADRQPRLREFIDIEAMLLALKGTTATNTGHSPCVIRAGFYAENILLYGEHARLEGKLPLPIGPDHKFAPIALGDVAQVAAHVLTGRGPHGLSEQHRGQLMVLTGPKLVAGNELAEAARQALGTPYEFVNISEEQAVQILSTTDLDESEKEYLLNYYSLVREGKANYVSTTAFENIIGSRPTDIVDFFKMYPAEFARKQAKKSRRRH